MKKVLIALSLVGMSLSAQAGIKLSTGYFYAKGQSNDLNVKDSVIKAVPIGIKYKRDKFGVRLSSSYLRLENGASTVEGMGDTSLSLSYDVLENPWITLTVKEKFATGDKNKGLSTGYNDTKVQADYFRVMGKGKSLFATLGYTFKGGQDQVKMYQNGVYASLGAGFSLVKGWNAGGSVDYTQKTNKNLDDVYGGSVFLGHKLSRQFSVSLFAGYDNTDTLSAGFGLSYKLK